VRPRVRSRSGSVGNASNTKERLTVNSSWTGGGVLRWKLNVSSVLEINKRAVVICESVSGARVILAQGVEYIPRECCWGAWSSCAMHSGLRWCPEPNASASVRFRCIRSCSRVHQERCRKIGGEFSGKSTVLDAPAGKQSVGVGETRTEATSRRYWSFMTGAAHVQERMATGKACDRSDTGRQEFLFARLVSTDCWIATTISVARHDLHRYNTHMDFRESLSKRVKKLKGKLPGGSRKRDGRSRSEDGRKGSEVDVKGGDTSQRNPYLRSEVSVVGAVEGGPSRERTNVDGIKAALVDADPPTSVPLIDITEPDSM